MAQSDLRVTSHVGRDLLASAGPFRTEASVVWEYVVNSLQYVERGVSPIVDVQIRPRRRAIAISDNGKGMTRETLNHFFKMHGENLERQAGRPGRGKFGTGKSAAFGIANALRVDTVRDGKRNVVLLTRSAIDASDGSDIPLEHVIVDEPTDSTNGTVIGIEDIALDRVDARSIIEYVERHLAAFRSSAPQVAINNHVCEYNEPRVARSRTFRPNDEQRKELGDIELTVKVAQAPLPDADQGIFVTAGVGNLVAIERGGMERKEFGSYLFGEVNVPALESHESKIQPYDATRSLQLNPRHPLVAVLVGFIGSRLDQVRKELVAEEREARKTEEARRLHEESQRIAELLNQDFDALRSRLYEIRAATSHPGRAEATFGQKQGANDDPDEWIEGIEEPGVLVASDTATKEAQPSGRVDPLVPSRGERDIQGKELVSPAGGEGSRKRRPHGGFNVDYRHLGRDEDRSKYEASTLTIIINLDHPVVAAALNHGVEDLAFKRLCYEIAFSEYSVALGYEMARVDPEIPADDLLYEVRTTLNRIARGSAALYVAY